MPYIRTRNLYNPESTEPFKLSRSKVSNFLACPRCFYLDRRLGIGTPSIPGYTLNSAVDALLKKEFDILRKQGRAHDLMKAYHVDAVPYDHPDIDTWRNNFTGMQYLDKKTNLIIFGAVDDVWIDNKGKLIIVDYKSTSSEKEVSLEDEWKQWYKIQMEIYQWLFQKNGFKVSDTGYFVYANAGKNRPSFDGVLEFKLTLLPYKGDTSWVNGVISDIKKCLDSDTIPDADPDCEYCTYRSAAEKVEGNS